MLADDREIAANDRVEPQVDAGAEHDVAGHHRSGGNVIILDGANRGGLWQFSVENSKTQACMPTPATPWQTSVHRMVCDVCYGC